MSASFSLMIIQENLDRKFTEEQIENFNKLTRENSMQSSANISNSLSKERTKKSMLPPDYVSRPLHIDTTPSRPGEYVHNRDAIETQTPIFKYALHRTDSIFTQYSENSLPIPKLKIVDAANKKDSIVEIRQRFLGRRAERILLEEKLKAFRDASTQTDAPMSAPIMRPSSFGGCSE
jgi:hypothetical protein